MRETDSVLSPTPQERVEDIDSELRSRLKVRQRVLVCVYVCKRDTERERMIML